MWCDRLNVVHRFGFERVHVADHESPFELAQRAVDEQALADEAALRVPDEHDAGVRMRVGDPVDDGADDGHRVEHRRDVAAELGHEVHGEARPHEPLAERLHELPALDDAQDAHDVHARAGDAKRVRTGPVERRAEVHPRRERVVARPHRDLRRVDRVDVAEAGRDERSQRDAHPQRLVAADFGQPALGLTDHGVMNGAVEHFQVGIKVKFNGDGTYLFT